MRTNMLGALAAIFASAFPGGAHKHNGGAADARGFFWKKSREDHAAESASAYARMGKPRKAKAEARRARRASQRKDAAK